MTAVARTARLLTSPLSPSGSSPPRRPPAPLRRRRSPASTRPRWGEYDYGAIKLDCSIGNTVGWFGYYTAPWNSLNGTSTTVSGYHGDKGGEQWRSFDHVRSSTERKVFYNNDTTGGASGSPVYHYRDGKGPYSIAIHAYGTSRDSVHNSGTRITQAVFDNFAYWRAL